MHDAAKRLCVALDGTDHGWITSMAERLAGHVGWFKVGLEAFTAHGPDLIRNVADIGGNVFLDLKLHDIPNTVKHAAANCAATGARMFNIHAGGGRRMMEAAVEGASSTSPRPLVLAVTVLTSLDREALTELGINVPPEELVVRWAETAQAAGLDGVVASAREAAAIRTACGESFTIVTPGIRPGWAAQDDQRRIVTPADGVAAGADILVIGRPITRADDPVAAADSITREIQEA